MTNEWLTDNENALNENIAAPPRAAEAGAAVAKVPAAESVIERPPESIPAEREAPAAPDLLSPQQLEDLRIKAAKADEHWERFVRVTADFDNFKKRAARERQDAIKYANEALLEKLISALDSFEMALSAASKPESVTVESLKSGILMVYQQLKSTLADAGLEEIDASDHPFNPNLHQAVSQQESAEAPEGHVLQQLRKGFKLRERLLRPASVVVSRKPAAG